MGLHGLAVHCGTELQTGRSGLAHDCVPEFSGAANRGRRNRAEVLICSGYVFAAGSASGGGLIGGESSLEPGAYHLCERRAGLSIKFATS